MQSLLVGVGPACKQTRAGRARKRCGSHASCAGGRPGGCRGRAGGWPGAASTVAGCCPQRSGAVPGFASRRRATSDEFSPLGVVFTGMSNAGIAIRPAAADDAAAIGAVFDAAVGAGWTYLGQLVQEPMFGPEEWEREVAAHAPPNVLLVACDEAAGAIVGFVAAHPADGELYLLFVHPDAAGRGVGRRLLDAAHDALR